MIFHARKALHVLYSGINSQECISPLSSSLDVLTVLMILNVLEMNFVLGRCCPGCAMSVELLSLMGPGVWRILSVRMCAVGGDVVLVRLIVTVLEISFAGTCEF